MTTKLTIANGCMRILKERHLTSAELTAGVREPAALFNAVWDDGGVNGALEAGQWKFAKRTLQLDANVSIETSFGYANAFDKPSDFVRTMGVWGDSSLTYPLNRYLEENGLWYADADPIYVSYVSNGADYGLDYSLWPQSFVHFVHAHFAMLIAGPLSDKGMEATKLRDFYLKNALSTDAMADPTKFTPAGSWVRARMRSGRSWPDGNPR